MHFVLIIPFEYSALYLNLCSYFDHINFRHFILLIALQPHIL